LFPLRNEVPRHHGGQAGHAHHLGHGLTLAERFLAAMTPKVVLTRGLESLSVFREGCPYHAIMTGAAYDQRPDILVLRGSPMEEFPRLDSRGTTQVVQFKFRLADVGEVAGEVQVRNSPHVPLLWRKPANGCKVAVRGIIECSVRKTVELAGSQVDVYRRVFRPQAIALVTGNQLPGIAASNAVISLHGDDDSLVADLGAAAALAVVTFGMKAQRVEQPRE
jgi:hypothetical protein